MKKFLLPLTLFLVFACSKVEDDSDVACTGDCTRVEGRIFTKDNQPVKNAKVIFRYRKSTGFNSNYYRILGDDRTDANGNYSMDFYLKDEELMPETGSFELYVKKATLPGQVFVEYDFNLWDSFIEIDHRDTILVKDMYLPSKRTVKVNLQNFVPLAAGDKFQLEYYHPVGFEGFALNDFGNRHNYQGSTINGLNVTGNASSFTVKMADNEYNVISLVRIKNGVYSEEHIPVFIDSASPTEFTYDF